ncbi:MAG: hypothetical protein HYU30_06865 [Chloroflexi bacterium]|nr:hypothetical protein [Chloroflexota bacterium]
MPPARRTYGRQVFINCPFDAAYQAMFDAIVFSVFRCGYLPRCSKEVLDSGDIRLDKIVRLVGDCRLAIHDISRTEPNKEGLPRFNMPLELGLFLGAKRFGDKGQQQKRCLILDREPYRYQQFISDLSGLDVEAHGADPERAVTVIRNWLSFKGSVLLSGTILWREYQEFQEHLPEICDKFHLLPAELTFKDTVTAIEYWLSATEESVRQGSLK